MLKLQRNKTKLILLLAFFTSFAFQGDNEIFDFYLSSHGAYYPNDNRISINYSGGNSAAGTLMLRAYKVNNPVEFFKEQDNPHSPQFKDPTPANFISMIKTGFNKAKKDFGLSSLDYLSYDTRDIIQNVVDYRGTEEKEVIISKKTVTPKLNTSSKPKYKNKQNTKPVTQANKPTKGKPNTNIKAAITMPPPPKEAEDFPVVLEWKHNLLQTKDSYRDETINVPITGKGVYVIEGYQRGKTHRTLLIISEYGAVLKQQGKNVLVYVANQLTGEKISSFPISFLENKVDILKDKTDANGVLKTVVPYQKNTNDLYGDSGYETRIILGELNGNFVICDQMSYDYFNDENSNSSIYIQTDRPVYRPAQTAYYRAVLRNKTEGGAYIQPSKGDTILVEIIDSKDAVIKKDTLITNEFGSVNNSIQLNEEAATGTYTLKTTYKNSEEHQNFEVEEYKKPEYKVEVVTNKQKYTRGDTIRATVKANYFFGSPVSTAKVNYFIYSQPYRQPWYADTEWEYLYSNSSSNYSTFRSSLVYSSSADLNSDGTYNIVFPTSKSLNDGYTYRIKASVEDNSRRAIEATASVIVTFSEFYLNSITDKYVYTKNDEIAIYANAKNYETKQFIPVKISTTVSKITWKKITTNDQYNNVKFEPVYTKVWSGNFTTNNTKETILKIPTLNKTGYFQISLLSTDKNGTEVTSTNNVYVGEQEFSSSDNSNDNYSNFGGLKIIPDKTSYNPGETINALIVGPAPKVDVLITQEGETIYNHAVERFSENSQIVHLIADESMLPNFSLNAVIIVNGRIYTGEENITIVPNEKLLKIEVLTDKAKYLPGEQATVTVKTLNSKNEPSPYAEIALGFVDEAIYSISPDITPNVKRYFYSPRYNHVNTSYSSSYNFYNEFMSLTPRNNDFFGFAANNTLRKIYLGDVKGNLLVQPAVRKDFKDVAFWKPDLVTDSKGIAKVTFKMPDNLTAWRIAARAINKKTEVGQVFSSTLVRKELLLRMETPRFINQGDELDVAVNVHNYLLTDKEVKIQLTGENVTSLQKDTTIKIIADGEKRVDWKILSKESGNIKLVAKALTNEESDAMEINVPVLPTGLQVSNGSAMEMQNNTSTQNMKLNIPQNSSNPALYLTFTPSLAGGLLGSLNSLIGYPYGCVEQTMSRFLPAVIVSNNLEKLKIPLDNKLKNQLPRIVQKGFNRLYQLQHSDGGWGWWENDVSHPFMTAYVVYGLAMARRCGFEVSNETYDNGLRGLGQFLKGEYETDHFNPQGKKYKVKNKIDATTMAYIAYALSVVNSSKSTKENCLKICNSLSKTDTLNSYAVALLVLAYNNSGEKQLAKNLSQKLSSSATNSDGLAYWSGRSFYYNWQDDRIETTAMAIRALLETQGTTPLTSNATQWLLTQRRDFGWGNTRQTAMVVYALSDYLNQTNETNPNYDLSISVNGQNILSKKITNKDVYLPEEKIKVDAKYIKQGENIIQINKSGSGKLYASGIANYFSKNTEIASGGAGFKVTREYYILRKQVLKSKLNSTDSIVYNKSAYNGVVKSGDEIFVKVIITPQRDYDYVMLEEPIAAGCEVIKNTNGYNIANENEYSYSNNNYFSWDKWYDSRDIRDEKIAFFANSVSSGRKEITYLLRAQIPGKFTITPSKVSLMYYPEISGNSNSEKMEILK